TAHSERAHPGAPRTAVALPGALPVVDEERARLEVDLRVRRLEVERGRYDAALDAQDRLDQAGHAGGRREMPDVALHRSQRAVVLLVRPGAEGLRERGPLDRIAGERRRAVPLDVADRRGIDARH